MRFVLDCSVAISWCMTDENDTYANAIWNLMSENEAIVPTIWWLEIVNVLIVAERRQRITETQTAQELSMLQSLPIVVDTNADQQSTTATLALARQYNLAAYDAAYLELSIREGLLLATIDGRLVEAARRCGVFLEVPNVEDTP